MIAVVFQVPLVNGKPDLKLPAGVDMQRDGDVINFTHETHGEFSVRHLGTPAGGPVFIGMMPQRVLTFLRERLGPTEALRLRTAWQNATMRTWLMSRGVREENGAPIHQHVIAGYGASPDTDTPTFVPFVAVPPPPDPPPLGPPMDPANLP